MAGRFQSRRYKGMIDIVVRRVLGRPAREL
jgi:hypothetical protein